MNAQAIYRPMPIDQLVEQILRSRKITRDDQRQLMTLFAQASLDSQESSLVQRIHEALSRGLLRVVD